MISRHTRKHSLQMFASVPVTTTRVLLGRLWQNVHRWSNPALASLSGAFFKVPDPTLLAVVTQASQM
jgi:hypothetical protein